MDELFWELLIALGGLVLLYNLTEPLWTGILPDPGNPAQDTRPTPNRTGQKQAATAQREPPTRVIARETTPTDPKDTAAYLRRQGWVLTNRSPRRYLGYYQGGGVAMEGGLERTPGGRRKFFVKNPPQGFIRKAEEGDCLPEDPDVREDAFRVHFDPHPDSFGDGVEVIENMLEDAYA